MNLFEYIKTMKPFEGLIECILNIQIVPSYIFIIFTTSIFNCMYAIENYIMTTKEIVLCFAINLELLFLVIIVICSDLEKLFERPVELFVTQLSIIVSVRRFHPECHLDIWLINWFDQEYVHLFLADLHLWFQTSFPEALQPCELPVKEKTES